jgi:hypothetical protein
VTVRTLLCFAIVAGLLLATSRSSAQDAPSGPVLQLFSAPVGFDGVVYVNGMLENPGGPVVRELRQTVKFPHDKLQFTGARLGFAGDVAGATLEVVMKDRSGQKVDKRELAQTLDLRIVSPAPLGEGPILELKFRVVEAKKQTITLAHQVNALDGAGAPIAGLVFGDGEVVVTDELGPLAPVVFGCFFYMH